MMHKSYILMRNNNLDVVPLFCLVYQFFWKFWFVFNFCFVDIFCCTYLPQRDLIKWYRDDEVVQYICWCPRPIAIAPSFEWHSSNVWKGCGFENMLVLWIQSCSWTLWQGRVYSGKYDCIVFITSFAYWGKAAKNRWGIGDKGGQNLLTTQWI